jgi:hypothetical protein
VLAQLCSLRDLWIEAEPEVRATSLRLATGGSWFTTGATGLMHWVQHSLSSDSAVCVQRQMCKGRTMIEWCASG